MVAGQYRQPENAFARFSGCLKPPHAALAGKILHANIVALRGQLGQALAGESCGDGLRAQAARGGGERAVVVAAALPEAIALRVYAHDGQHHNIERFCADFVAAKLGHLDLAAAARAFGLGCFNSVEACGFQAALAHDGVGREPEFQAAWGDVGQIDLCAALLGGAGEAVQPQLAADCPIYGDAFAAFDEAFELAVDAAFGGAAGVFRLLFAGKAQFAADFALARLRR